MMDLATLKQQAERCRRLAKDADPFTQKRLEDLAWNTTPASRSWSPSFRRHQKICVMASCNRFRSRGGAAGGRKILRAILTSSALGQ
jgi:hypothetical protein